MAQHLEEELTNRKHVGEAYVKMGRGLDVNAVMASLEVSLQPVAAAALSSLSRPC